MAPPLLSGDVRIHRILREIEEVSFYFRLGKNINGNNDKPFFTLLILIMHYVCGI